MTKTTVNPLDFAEIREGIESQSSTGNVFAVETDPTAPVIYLEGDNGFYKVTVVEISDEEFDNANPEE